jgi:predicted ATPase
MQKLDRIQIKGFKSIREMDLELNALNILIGANGAGKSNFIEVFRLLREIVKQRLQYYVQKSGGANTLLHFGEKVTDLIFLKFTFEVGEYEAKFYSTKDDTLLIAESGNIIGLRFKKPSPHQETLLATDNSLRPFFQALMFVIQGWQVYHFHDTSDTALVKKTHDLNDNEYLRPDASNLAAFLYLLQEKYPHEYKQIVETIRLAAPFFDDFHLRPNPLNEDKIILEWHEKNSDAYFDASYLSDGTLRFMCLTTLLLQPNLPSTILIDEPELGLHPFAITSLARMLKAASTLSQVIVSTQSVPLVNQFFPEDIIVVDRIEGQSTFRRPDPESLTLWLEDYGVGDLWQKNVIGGRPQR